MPVLTVDLGYAMKCEPWKVESYQFPSKIGGKPAWLDLKHLPRPEELQCGVCKEPTVFLCQVYAPLRIHSSFHRTMFVFICRNKECCQRNSSSNVKVFRNTLPRKNDFYSYDPVEEKLEVFIMETYVRLCQVCGCLSLKRCSKCKVRKYCSKEHQKIDWKEGHKRACLKSRSDERISSLLFPEFQLGIDSEEISDEEYVDELEELEKFRQLEIEDKTGTMKDVPEEELEAHAAQDGDKVFRNFKKRIDFNPYQVLRFDRGGEPLWISDSAYPETIPNCEQCGSERQFEFQVMPQMLGYFKEYDIDWGIIAVYTCKSSCDLAPGYRPEFAFKQDLRS